MGKKKQKHLFICDKCYKGKQPKPNVHDRRMCGMCGVTFYSGFKMPNYDDKKITIIKDAAITNKTMSTVTFNVSNKKAGTAIINSDLLQYLCQVLDADIKIK